MLWIRWSVRSTILSKQLELYAITGYFYVGCAGDSRTSKDVPIYFAGVPRYKFTYRVRWPTYLTKPCCPTACLFLNISQTTDHSLARSPRSLYIMVGTHAGRELIQERKHSTCWDHKGSIPQCISRWIYRRGCLWFLVENMMNTSCFGKTRPNLKHLRKKH